MILQVRPFMIKKWLYHPFFSYLSLLIWLIPFTFTILHYTDRFNELSEQKIEAELLYKRSIISKKKVLGDEVLIGQMKGASPYYLERSVESLPLLSAEIAKWQQVSLDNPSIQAIENRLKFLKGDQNCLRFKKSAPQYQGPYVEILATQSRPVEVNEEDLKKILSVVEGVKIGRFTPEAKRPQLIIEKFDLKKTTHPDLKEKVFLLSMELIERDLTGDTTQ